MLAAGVMGSSRNAPAPIIDADARSRPFVTAYGHIAILLRRCTLKCMASGLRENVTSGSQFHEACNILHHRLNPAQWHTFTVQHIAKHRHCRSARGIFLVEAR